MLQYVLQEPRTLLQHGDGGGYVAVVANIAAGVVVEHHADNLLDDRWLVSAVKN